MKKAKFIMKIVAILLLVVDIAFSIAYFATRNYAFHTVSDIVNCTLWIAIFLAIFLPDQKKPVDSNTTDNTQQNSDQEQHDTN